MRIAVISDKNARRYFVEAAAIAIHRSIKIITSHYTRSVMKFNATTPKHTKSKTLE